MSSRANPRSQGPSSLTLASAPVSNNSHNNGLDNSESSHRKRPLPSRNANGTTTNATTSKPRSSFSLMKTLLMAGLLFCCADLAFFVYHLEAFDQLSSLSSSPSSVLHRVSPSNVKADLTGSAKSESSTTGISNNENKMSSDNASPLQNSNANKNNNDPNDKTVLLNLLRDAGIPETDLTPDIIQQLPTWAEVTDLYGSEPIIWGLDTCETFQKHSDPAEHFLGTAGTFNTGTNLLAALITENCHMPERVKKYGDVNRGMRWQVPWGKHTPVDNEEFRQTHKAQGDKNIPANDTMPVVTIRDPALWMPSMCRHEYAMDWPHPDITKKKTTAAHCPNLIATPPDLELDPTLTLGAPIPVDVEYAKFTKFYPSMAHHWNIWYRDYYDASWPRLIIRFEDLIFHPKQVVQTVCECAGGQLDTDHPFQYMVESAKVGEAHGTDKTNFMDAMIKYGRHLHRWKGMASQDLDFAGKVLDPTLMGTFHYLYPAQSQLTATAAAPPAQS
jgi:hypothetical protein